MNLLVEIGLASGINLDKPERARKVGNEFIGWAADVDSEGVNSLTAWNTVVKEGSMANQFRLPVPFPFQ